MNFCPNCGQKMEGKFCGNCGNSSETVVAPYAPVKAKNGKGVASMILGIVAIIWALMSLLSIGSVEEKLVELELDLISSGDTTAGYIGFIIGYNLFSLPCGIVGLILGLRAKKDGKAISGIIMSAISLVIAIVCSIIIINTINW